MTTRNFATNPRTANESFGIIQQALLAQNVIPNKYSAGVKACAIGHLFTDAQRKYIVDFGLNESELGQLIHEIGKDNIKAMTGFTPHQMSQLIEAVDYADNNNFKSLRTKLNNGLARGHVRIGTCMFKL
jgi:hypothetical protein